MRVAVFHSGFKGFGGAEVLAAAQARSLREQGEEVGIFTFAHDPHLWDQALGHAPVKVLPKREWTDALSFWHPTFKLHRRGLKAADAFRAFGADLVLAHNQPCPALLGWADLEVRKVWYCHEPHRSLFPQVLNRGLLGEVAAGRAPEAMVALSRAWTMSPEGGWRMRARRAFDRGGIGRLHHVLANSAYTQESLRMVYGPRDIDVVHPMVSEPTAVQPRQGLRTGGLQILVQGRLEALKNIETVILGFDRFCQRRDRSARLHIVGDGRDRAALQALAATLPSAKAITFHGFMDEARLAELRGVCDVFALLPLDEPFGMVFPEAALHGQLLVGPNHGGPLEILEGGALGWALPPFSAEALAEAFEAIQALPDSEVDHYRQRAAQSCRARFSPDVVLPRLHALLRAFVQRARRS